jgi:hypothetical protein
MQKNVIIVGVPRSGTSMASYIFASHRYFVAEEPAKDLRQGDEYNPSGYWEAARLIDANVELFKTVDYPHHNTWLFDPITQEQAARLGALPGRQEHRKLVECYDSKAPWLWKDPRLCYTLGYWWPLLNPETTAVLLLTRNPEHVFKSFVRVGWRKNEADRPEVDTLLAAHMAAAHHAIRRYKIPHIVLAYEEFETQPEQTARKISGFFGLDIGVQDLSFNELLNHSSAKGGLVARLETVAASLPARWRTLMKQLVPAGTLAKIFPGRKR